MILLVGILSLLVTTLNGGADAAAKGYGGRIVQAPVVVSDGLGGAAIISGQGGSILDPASQVQEHIGLGSSGLTPNTPLYRIGQSSVPYGLSGQDYYSYPAVRLTRGGGGLKGGGLGGLGGGIITSQPTFLGGGLGGPVVRKTFGNGLGGGKTNFGRVYDIGASRIPYGPSGQDFFSFPNGLLSGRRVGGPILAGKTNLGGGPIIVSSGGLGGLGGGGLGGLGGGLGGGNIRFVFGGDPSLSAVKGGGGRIVYRTGQSQVPFGLSGLDFGSYPANLVAGGSGGGGIVQELINPGGGFGLGDQQSHISGLGSGKSTLSILNGVNSFSVPNQILSQTKGLDDNSEIAQVKVVDSGIGNSVKGKVPVSGSGIRTQVGGIGGGSTVKFTLGGTDVIRSPVEVIHGVQDIPAIRPVTVSRIPETRIQVESPHSGINIRTGGGSVVPRPVGTTGGGSNVQFTLGGTEIIRGPGAAISGDVQVIPRVSRPVTITQVSQPGIPLQRRRPDIRVTSGVGVIPRPAGGAGGGSNVHFTLGGTDIIRRPTGVIGGSVQEIPRISSPVTVTRVSQPAIQVQRRRPDINVITGSGGAISRPVGGAGGSNVHFTLGGTDIIRGQGGVISGGGGVQEIPRVRRPVTVTHVSQPAIQVQRRRPDIKVISGGDRKISRPVGGVDGGSNVHFTLGGTDIIRGQGGVIRGGGVQGIPRVSRPVTVTRVSQPAIQVQRPRPDINVITGSGGAISRPVGGAGGSNVHFTLGGTDIIRGQGGVISGGGVQEIPRVRRPVTVTHVSQPAIQVQRRRPDIKVITGGDRTISRPVGGVGGGSNVHFTLGGTDIIRGQGGVIRGVGGVQEIPRVSRPVTVTHVSKPAIEVQRRRPDINVLVGDRGVISRPQGGAAGGSNVHFTLGGTDIIRGQGGVFSSGGGGGGIQEIPRVSRPVTVTRVSQPRIQVQRPRPDIKVLTGGGGAISRPVGGSSGGGGSNVHFTLGGTDIIRGQGVIKSGGGIREIPKVSRPVTVTRVSQPAIQVQRRRPDIKVITGGGGAISRPQGGTGGSNVHFTLGGTDIIRGQGGVFSSGGGVQEIPRVSRPVTVTRVSQPGIQVQRPRPDIKVLTGGGGAISRPVGGTSSGGGVSNVHFTLGGTDIIRGQGGIIRGGGIREIAKVSRPVTVTRISQPAIQVQRRRPDISVLTGDRGAISRPQGGTGGGSNVHFTLGGTDIIRGQGGVFSSGGGVQEIPRVSRPVTVTHVSQPRIQVQRPRPDIKVLTGGGGVVSRPVGGASSGGGGSNVYFTLGGTDIIRGQGGIISGGGIREIPKVSRPVTVTHISQPAIQVQRRRPDISVLTGGGGAISRPIGGVGGGSNVHFTLGGTDIIRGPGGVISGGGGVQEIPRVSRPVTISRVPQTTVQVARPRPSVGVRTDGSGIVSRPIGGTDGSNIHFTLGGTDIIRGPVGVLSSGGSVQQIPQVRRPVIVSEIPATRIQVERPRPAINIISGGSSHYAPRPVSGTGGVPGVPGVHFVLGDTEIIRGPGASVSGFGVQKPPSSYTSGIQAARPIPRPIAGTGGGSNVQYTLGGVELIHGQGGIISSGIPEISRIARPVTVSRIPETRIQVERPHPAVGIFADGGRQVVDAGTILRTSPPRVSQVKVLDELSGLGGLGDISRIISPQISTGVREQTFSLENNGLGGITGLLDANVVQEKVSVENGGFSKFPTDGISPARVVVQEKVTGGLFDSGILGSQPQDINRLSAISQQNQNTGSGSRVVQEHVEQILVK